MTVTKIEPVTKTRYKVYVDGQFAFVLYKGELSRYHIAEDSELEEEIYQNLRKEIVLKRAKLRAMHLLNDMGRTESQLRTKLLRNDYPPDIVEEAIAYVKSFGYINDAEYARNFIENRKEKKSKKEIYAALCQKGLPKDLIETALEERYADDDSIAAIEAIVRKKKFDPKSTDYREMQKMMGYLVRKGFRYDDIRQVIQVSEWNA
ncbi:regulatory protein RecX [Blautia obeum]|uniref:regulatory protein RecX n=1 Tax=Blautia obeum TaxID=40520 RepID=UPI002A8C58A1|nr:regulatory protein RecX [Lachnospiraceae bacterium]MCI6534219.1 regulatory protein RecX [Lachnospiraceae bacterium]MDY4206412.1 regulatory protein RecX [Lachnospiraceae bacterium]